jgi:AraC-like DNA-binding protein
MINQTIKSNIPKTTIHATPTRVSTGAGAFPPHRHDELELLLIYEGVFACNVGGKEYIGEAGDVIFVNSGVPHSTRSIDSAVTGLLQFKQTNFLDPDIAKIIKYSVRLNNLSDEPVKILRSADLFNTIKEIFDESEKKGTAYEFYVKSGVYRIMGYLYREGILSDAEKLYSTKEMQKILPALAYINSSYAEDVTLEEASAKLSFDPSYFCRLFKSAVGATFTEYLNFVRVCKAEKLLSETDGSVIEISEAVGFSSVSYFNRVFKKFRGCTPRYYRATKTKGDM